MPWQFKEGRSLLVGGHLKGFIKEVTYELVLEGWVVFDSRIRGVAY